MVADLEAFAVDDEGHAFEIDSLGKVVTQGLEEAVVDGVEVLGGNAAKVDVPQGLNVGALGKAHI